MWFFRTRLQLSMFVSFWCALRTNVFDSAVPANSSLYSSHLCATPPKEEAPPYRFLRLALIIPPCSICLTGCPFYRNESSFNESLHSFSMCCPQLKKRTTPYRIVHFGLPTPRASIRVTGCSFEANRFDFGVPAQLISVCVLSRPQQSPPGIVLCVLRSQPHLSIGVSLRVLCKHTMLILVVRSIHLACVLHKSLDSSSGLLINIRKMKTPCFC